jgi:predicted MFS family arabinose efflux permease
MTRTYRQRGPLRTLTVATLAVIASVLPMFMVSALAAQMTEDLVFGAIGLGGAIAANRAFGLITAPYMGRVVDRMGATFALRASALIALVSSLGVALTARNWASLAIWMVVSSSSNVLAQPAANRMLARNIPAARLGIAFGLNKSAPPTASMIAGFSVPLIGLTLGWRWAFVLAAALAMVVFLAVGPMPPRDGPAPVRTPLAPLPDRRGLALMGVAFLFGNWANAAVSTFYVAAAVRDGTRPSLAGVFLAVASIAAILTRMTMGAVSDRIRTHHLNLCAGLMAFGALGAVLLSRGGTTTMALGAVISLMGAWGFHGVFWFALVRLYPEAPGRVTGVLSPGGLLGHTIGPLVFGLVAETASYPAAWLVTAAAAVIGAATMAVGAHHVRGRAAIG